MATPAIQTLITDAQQVLNLKSLSEIRATLTAVLANANVGTPLNPNLTTQQLWDEFYEIVRQTPTDIESILVNQMMKFVFSPPAPGGAGANTQVIFNDGGTLAGDAGLTYNKTTDKLTVGTNVDIWRGLLNDSSSTAVGSSSLAATTAGATGNTALGAGSGGGISSGTYNISVGVNALYKATGVITGSNNICVGSNSGSSSGVISGSYNIGVGAETLRALSSGADNVAIGRTALTGLTAAVSNVALGFGTLATLSTGSYNIAIGQSALNACVVSDQVGVGIQALQNLQNGTNNTAVGRDTLRQVVSNSNNTALGYQAARATIAADITAIGSNALVLSTGGNNNTAVGSGSMGATIVTGGSNTVIGASAGNALTSGDSNVFIGADSGNGVSNGGSNICIGRGSTVVGANSNQIAFGSSTYFVGTNGVANTYYANAVGGTVLPPAGATGFWRLAINGTFRKIAVYAD